MRRYASFAALFDAFDVAFLYRHDYFHHYSPIYFAATPLIDHAHLR